jgi:hypothetical protein
MSAFATSARNFSGLPTSQIYPCSHSTTRPVQSNREAFASREYPSTPTIPCAEIYCDVEPVVIIILFTTSEPPSPRQDPHSYPHLISVQQSALCFHQRSERSFRFQARETRLLCYLHYRLLMFFTRLSRSLVLLITRASISYRFSGKPIGCFPLMSSHV